jgi:hypothetical protein
LTTDLNEFKDPDLVILCCSENATELDGSGDKEGKLPIARDFLPVILVPTLSCPIILELTPDDSSWSEASYTDDRPLVTVVLSEVVDVITEAVA